MAPPQAPRQTIDLTGSDSSTARPGPADSALHASRLAVPTEPTTLYHVRTIPTNPAKTLLAAIDLTSSSTAHLGSAKFASHVYWAGSVSIEPLSPSVGTQSVHAAVSTPLYLVRGQSHQKDMAVVMEVVGVSEVCAGGGGLRRRMGVEDFARWGVNGLWSRTMVGAKDMEWRGISPAQEVLANSAAVD